MRELFNDDLNKFIERMKDVHGNRFLYDNALYINQNTSVNPSGVFFSAEIEAQL